MNEEDALIEEQAFMENLTKAELRESRALCSSLRTKLKYYGDEIARLRLVTMFAQRREVTVGNRIRTSLFLAACYQLDQHEPLPLNSVPSGMRNFGLLCLHMYTLQTI